MRSSVDLPAPLGPTTPSTSPGATVTDTPARTVAAPCALCRSCAIRVPATRPSVGSGDADRPAVMTQPSYDPDPRVDEYIDALPGWQRAICHEVRELVHAADPEVQETIK